MQATSISVIIDFWANLWGIECSTRCWDLNMDTLFNGCNNCIFDISGNFNNQNKLVFERHIIFIFQIWTIYTFALFSNRQTKKWNIRVVVVWYKNVRVYVLRSFCCCYQRNKRLCAHFSRTNDNFSSHILHIVDIVNMRIIIYPMLKCRLFFFSCSWEIRATIWCTVYITNAHRIFMHNTGCDSAWMCSYQNVGVCVHVHVWRKEI